MYLYNDTYISYNVQVQLKRSLIKLIGKKWQRIEIPKSEFYLK